MLLRYCLEKEDASDYVLCDVIGQRGADNQWRRECFRVVADHEKPLQLQSLWKPKDGFSRRFEIQLRASIEEQSLREQDTVTAGTLLPTRPLPAWVINQRASGGGAYLPLSLLAYCAAYQRLGRRDEVRSKQSFREGQRRSSQLLSYLCIVGGGPIKDP